MANVLVRKPRRAKERYPELHSGDRMTCAEFHRIYEQMPEKFKAELIGGVVYVASPLRLPHGSSHPYLTTVVTVYSGHTPGTQVTDNTTTFLSDEEEVQPDLALRILPEYGAANLERPPRSTSRGLLNGSRKLLTPAGPST